MLNVLQNLVQKLSVLVLATALSGCSLLFDQHVSWEYEEVDSYPVLRSVGYAPISAQPGMTPDIKNIMAMRASKLDAYRELAEQVYGHQIQGKTDMNNLVASDDKLRSRVDGVIRGARIIKSYAVGDNYVTEVELDMKLVYDLYRIQNRGRVIKRVDYY